MEGAAFASSHLGPQDLDANAVPVPLGLTWQPPGVFCAKPHEDTEALKLSALGGSVLKM